jgi:hypothetical protein
LFRVGDVEIVKSGFRFSIASRASLALQASPQIYDSGRHAAKKARKFPAAQSGDHPQ